MSSRTVSAIKQKQLDQREAYWPGSETRLWDRKTQNGFATIPKTMPLILQIMDELSKHKPLSSTYLALWCATWDNSFVNVAKPIEMAQAAGFRGQRAEYTWGDRMRRLHELYFIDIKPGKYGAISHVIIWNPHVVVREHHEAKTPGMSEGTYNMLIDKALEIGAKDVIQSAASDEITV